MSAAAVKLAPGHLMPLVGFGLWKVPRNQATDTVYNADEGVQRAIADGLVKREDIFITTKLWNTYHKKEHALSMAKRQNASWGLGYIDLFLIHFPVALKYVDPAKRQFPGWTYEDTGTIETEDSPIRETNESLESLVDQGIARSIGVSNFQGQLIYDVMRYARHPISALQIERSNSITGIFTNIFTAKAKTADNRSS